MENPWADAEWDTMPTELCEEVKPSFNYNEWLKLGHGLVQGHTDHQWKLGDWLIEGEDEFSNYGFEGIPRHLLIHKNGDGGCQSEKVPNFWDDILKETGMAKATLCQYAQTARAYPPENRFKQLTWCHHRVVCTYERRYEYLQAALPKDGGRPQTVAWLWKYAERQEEGPDKEFPAGFVRIPLSDELWAKLKDLGKYYGTPTSTLVTTQCVETVQTYINEKAYELSLKLLERHEPGMWPFDHMPREEKKPKRAYRRQRNSTAASRAHHSEGARDGWQKRRARMSENRQVISIRRIG